MVPTDAIGEVIRRAQTDLRRAEAADQAAEAAQSKANAARAETQAELARMRTVLEWLQRRDGAGASPQAPRPIPTLTPPRPAPTANNYEVCEWGFEQLGGSSKNPDLRAFLNREGYPFTSTQIRNAIKYLAKTEKIVNEGGGLWRLVTEGSHNPYPPAPATGVPPMNGTGTVPLA